MWNLKEAVSHAAAAALKGNADRKNGGILGRLLGTMRARPDRGAVIPNKRFGPGRKPDIRRSVASEPAGDGMGSAARGDSISALLNKDVQGTVELYCDHADAALRDGRRFEIRYNSNSLDASYVVLMETYVSVLAARFPSSEFRLIKSSFNDDRLFEVACYMRKGDVPAGKSDIRVRPEEGDLSNYLIRVVPMMNIAVAAASVTGDDQDEYDKLARYIGSQYFLLTGTPLALMGDRAEDIKSLKRLSITLPKTYRLNMSDQVLKNAMLGRLLESA